MSDNLTHSTNPDNMLTINPADTIRVYGEDGKHEDMTFGELLQQDSWTVSKIEVKADLHLPMADNDKLAISQDGECDGGNMNNPQRTAMVNIEDFNSRDDYLMAQLVASDNLNANCIFELEEAFSEEVTAKVKVRKSLLSSLVKLLANEENSENKLEDLTFGMAIELAKQGFKIARKGCNGKDMWLKAQFPDTHSKMTLPYLYMKTVDGSLVPWLASQTDEFAEDWMVVD